MKKNKKRRKLHEIDLEQDIRYRGPLSYRSFRILGWLCIAMSQLIVIFGLVERFFPEIVAPMTPVLIILRTISTLSLPFLLIANYAVILDNKNGYKNQLLLNGAVAGLIILLFILFFYRYAGQVVRVVGSTEGNEIQALEGFFQSLSEKGHLSFNFFIDLVLCTLFLFFLDYRPKRIFIGRKLIWFRLLAILPVLYEIASIMLKQMAGMDRLVLPLFVYPMLTVKPPITFLVFLVMALFIKNRERQFCRHGRTHEEYKAFLKTNRNSLHFSVFAAILFVVAAVVDLLVLILIFFVQEEANGGMESVYRIIEELDIGSSVVLLPLAPIMLLFSYTRTYKNKIIDMLIPVGGVLAIILVYLESFHYVLGILPG